MAVHFDGTVVDIVETHQQFNQRGFSGSGGTYDGHLLALMNLGREIMNDDLLRIITEADMLKAYLTLRILQSHRICHGLFLFFFLQELKNTLGSRRRGLKHICHLGNLLNRLGKALDILDKGLNLTDFNGTADDLPAAHQSHHHITDIAHELHDGHHHTGEKLGFPGGLVKLFVGLPEGLCHGLLFVEDSDDVMAAIDLLHLTVNVSEKFLLLLEIFLGMFHNHAENSHGYRQDQYRQNCHQNADPKHHDENADQCGDRRNELRHTLVQALLEGINIVCHPRKHLSCGTALKIF